MAVFGSEVVIAFPKILDPENPPSGVITCNVVGESATAFPTRTDMDLPFAKRAQSRWSAAQRAIPLRRAASDKIERSVCSFSVIEALASMDFVQYGATLDEGAKIPYLRFTSDAQDFFYAWWSKLEGRLRGNSEHPIMCEHLGNIGVCCQVWR
jgi:hypothetical protein